MKFCRRKNCELDERQLMMRGNVFQHPMILYMVLILLNGWLHEEGVHWAGGLHEGMIIFWLGACLALCEYILRGITPAGSSNDIIYIMDGICGGALLILNMFHLADGSPLVSGASLTSEGGHLVVALLMLSVFCTYLVKRLAGRKETAEDED